MWRAALPAITAIAYLLIATVPCPPSAEVRAAVSHGDVSADSGSPSLIAPCECGAHGAADVSGGKRAVPFVLTVPAPAVPAPAPSFAHERAERLPDAPISVDSPVPIAA